MRLPGFLVLFFEYTAEHLFGYFMSYELRNEQKGGKGMIQPANDGDDPKNYEGFEGMNYEQFRQPFVPAHKERNGTTGERENGRRPDEA